MTEDEDLESFRAEVRAFLDAELPPEKRFAADGFANASKELTAWWQGVRAKRGWGAPGWPKQYGGCEWSLAKKRIFADESTKAGAPSYSPFGITMVAPVIYTFGTEEQKAEHLPHILDGTRFWCQGYSEPGAGSDLASLKTRAIRDGDHYVVNGQKTWTTQGHWADWIFCLVRTNTEVKQQNGISFLLIDMNTPGIEVRPIRTIDGMHHLNEVFFTDVRVPVENLVGNENDGWTYAKFLLGNERAGIAGVTRTSGDIARLREWAASTEHFVDPPINDPRIAQRLDDLEQRLAKLAALEARALESPSQSMEAMRLVAPLKLLGTELSQDVSELALDIAGPAALPRPAENRVHPYGQEGEHAMSVFLFGRAQSIYGGTNEVQKNILAKMMAAGL